MRSSAPVVFHIDPNIKDDIFIDIKPSAKKPELELVETKGEKITTPLEPARTIAEEKKHSPIKTISTNYLKGFEAEELEFFRNQYNKEIIELEEQIAEYKWSSYYYTIKYGSYLICNIPFLSYRLHTSQGGINPLVQVYVPGATVSPSFSSDLGKILSSMDFLVNITTYNPRKAAVRSTLAYANSERFWGKILDGCYEFYHDPRQTLISCKNYVKNSQLYQNPKLALKSGLIFIRDHSGTAAAFIRDQTVLNAFNITMSFSVISDIYSNLADYGRFIQIGTSVILVAMSTGWFMQVTNPSYYEGVEFFRNKKKYPWLMQEALRGNIALPFQVFLQGPVSTVALYLYTTAYYFTNVAQQITGHWPPAYIILPLSTWQLFCSRYPSTYNFYMANGIEVKRRLTQNREQQVGALIQRQVELLEQSGLTGTQLEKRKNQLKHNLISIQVAADREAREAKIIEEKGWAYWIKEEPIFVTTMLSYIASIGAVFGIRLIAPALMEHIVNEPISMNILGVLIGLGLVVLPLRAERQRITDKLVLEKLEHPEEIKPEEKAVQRCCPSVYRPTISRETLMGFFADVFNIGSGLANDLSNIGTGLRTFGQNPVYMTPIAIVAQQQMINKILFFGPKLRNTWKSAVEADKTRLTNVKSTLYSQHRKDSEEKKAAEVKDEMKSQVATSLRA